MNNNEIREIVQEEIRLGYAARQLEIREAIKAEFKDLVASLQSRKVDIYDARSVEDHFGNAACDRVIEAIGIMEIFD